jgi:hypothetical protein
MSFFSRPSLDDVQFKQLTGSTLTMSGNTDFVGTLRSKGIEINGSTGATFNASGTVLTYINGKIQLHPAGAGSTPSFNTNRTTTRSGIPAVNTGTGCTVQCFLEQYFFPAVPLSSSLSVATGGALRQFGDCNVGNLCWNVVKNTYPIRGISASTNGSNSYNCTILTNGNAGTTGGTISYTYPFICATPPTGTTSTSVGFSLCAKTCCNEVSVSTASINWENKNFYFNNGTLYTDNTISIILSATTGFLATNKSLTISQCFNNEFFYYAYPQSYGVPSFIVNGLPNNAWGNINTGTLYDMSYINTNGYSNQYYIARSDNRITGTFNISVS